MDKEKSNLSQTANVFPSVKEIRQRVRTRRENRLYWRVWKYVSEKGTSIKTEYHLIKAKKSDMPRSMRDYLENVIEYEPTKADMEYAQKVNERIKAMQEEE